MEDTGNQRGAERLGPAPAPAGDPAVARRMTPPGFELRRMRIVAIGDTHEQHWALIGGPRGDAGDDVLPRGDVLVHCGDIFRTSRVYSEAEFVKHVKNFNAFLGRVKPRYTHGILVIAGNHDRCLETAGAERVKALLTNATYLCDETVVIDGVSFHGTPFSCGHSGNRAFQDYDAKAPAHPRRRLPTSVDVLITHGAYPTKQIVEHFVAPSSRTPHGLRCRLHLAGHDHEYYGARVLDFGHTAFAREPEPENAPAEHPKSRVSSVTEAVSRSLAGDWSAALPHPALPLPQVAGIGPISEVAAHGTPHYRKFADSRLALTACEPAQPALLQAITAGCAVTGSDSGTSANTRHVLAPRQVTTVVASVLDLRYRLAHRPVEVDLWHYAPASELSSAQHALRFSHPPAATEADAAPEG